MAWRRRGCWPHRNTETQQLRHQQAASEPRRLLRPSTLLYPLLTSLCSNIFNLPTKRPDSPLTRFSGCYRSTSSSAMGTAPIQDRTSEFRSILGQAQKRLASSKVAANRQALLHQELPSQNTPPKRSEFARRAVEIGRGITATTAKLQRLAQCEWQGC